MIQQSTESTYKATCIETTPTSPALQKSHMPDQLLVWPQRRETL